MYLLVNKVKTMVKWTSKEKALEAKIRNAESMTKRKTSGECAVCKKDIVPGESCYYFEVDVKGFQWPIRQYICIKCHDEISAKPVDDSVAWLISYFGQHHEDLDL